MYIHNGDVLLFPVDEINGNKIVIEGEYVILAEGEITFHAHVLKKEKTKVYMDENNVMHIEVMVPVELKHIDMKTGKKADHNEIEIPAGKYRIGRIKEYDPFEKELRNVQD